MQFSLISQFQPLSTSVSSWKEVLKNKQWQYCKEKTQGLNTVNLNFFQNSVPQGAAWFQEGGGFVRTPQWPWQRAPVRRSLRPADSSSVGFACVSEIVSSPGTYNSVLNFNFVTFLEKQIGHIVKGFDILHTVCPSQPAFLACLFSH